MIRSRNSLKDEWNRHGERMISLGSPVIYDISQETIFDGKVGDEKMSTNDKISDPMIRSLYERKSVRVFTGKHISEDDVRIIAEAAAQAPTAGNQQLYTILRITDSEKKHRLSISCDNQPFIEEADLVLVFCADCLRWYRAYEEAGIVPRKPGEGDTKRATIEEFNSDNTRRLNLEETKAKIASLEYIQNELNGIPNIVK